ncbi:hypothetical protein ACA040_005081 [Xenophilus aerolatus]
MISPRFAVARHDVPAEPGAPDEVVAQLVQVQTLQRRRKLLATIELACARSVMQACEQRLQQAREALTVNEESAAIQRAHQLRELTNTQRSAQDVARWRRSDVARINGLMEHRRALDTATDALAKANADVAQRRRHQRRLEIIDEKYAAMLEQLLDSTC